MNKDLADICDIRDYSPKDLAFIKATMLRGLYYGDSWFSLIPKDRFMNAYKHFVDTLLASPKNIVKVAVLKEDSDVILGYSILSKDFTKIHWVFVKKDWREKGIGRALLPQYPVVATHLTITGKNLIHKFPGCVFDPFDV